MASLAVLHGLYNCIFSSIQLLSGKEGVMNRKTPDRLYARRLHHPPIRHQSASQGCEYK
jgi:hypothetical protein